MIWNKWALMTDLKVSPIVVAQNEKIDGKKFIQILFVCYKMVSIEILFAFQPIPVQAIESTGTQVLEQILRIMLPCFMAQEGLSPLNFYVEDEFHHATRGGARGVKSITNYVLSQHDELEAKFFEERASFEAK
ncbi:hypothetical protein LOK49_LG05G01673 [Camellia lanceoleosa]|uniref:Uncharacterized protein n=1 Tax=Camellia lanceoleosa TaxID=1840588 RepID=A0ACC0HSE2_9ERIC|nr:hypothetical protein LOK49_LG05G01673 [Camellia lanceoleosa]